MKDDADFGVGEGLQAQKADNNSEDFIGKGLGFRANPESFKHDAFDAITSEVNEEEEDH